MNLELLPLTQDDIDEQESFNCKIINYQIDGSEVQTEYFSGEWIDYVDNWEATLIQYILEKQEAERTYKTHYLPFLNN